MPGALPMRGGAAAVEQAGFGQHVGAGADAGDADAALGHRAHEGRASSSHVRRGLARPRRRPRSRCVIAPDGLKPRASISTPDELRTGPGVTASTLIDGGWPAKRAAISNTEIGPAASSNWKSGNTRTPIMMASCPELREIWHFKRGKYAHCQDNREPIMARHRAASSRNYGRASPA